MKPKKLVWQPCGEDEIFAEAHTWIEYVVNFSSVKFCLSAINGEIGTYLGTFPTIEEAKEAAQEHFNQFVQSLIEQQ